MFRMVVHLFLFQDFPTCLLAFREAAKKSETRLERERGRLFFVVALKAKICIFFPHPGFILKTNPTGKKTTTDARSETEGERSERKKK